MSVAVSEVFLLLPMIVPMPTPTATLVPLVFVPGVGVLTEPEVDFVVGIPSGRHCIRSRRTSRGW